MTPVLRDQMVELKYVASLVLGHKGARRILYSAVASNCAIVKHKINQHDIQQVLTHKTTTDNQIYVHVCI